MNDLVITNISRIVSGDIAAPFVDGDTVVVRGGLIAAIGSAAAVDRSGIDHVIDAAGCQLWPGLIDSHTHPVTGDFTPRQQTVGFIESGLHGGVTRIISAGEVHLPGRPKDAAGTRALAIVAAKAWASYRPGGVKVLGGSVILEPGLTAADFAYMAQEGVRVVGEIGLSGIYRPEDARPMVEWAHAHGMVVMMHIGGASIPGSSVLGAREALAILPDIASHTNGGPTAAPLADIERLMTESQMMIEVVQAGNTRRVGEIARLAVQHNVLPRMMIGTDTPSGTGVIPLGVLRTMAWVASLGEIAPELTVAMATGNTARIYRLNEGMLRAGAAADMILVDTPVGSEAQDALATLALGDTPAVAAVIIDGVVRVNVSRNTPAATHRPRIPWLAAGGH
ncbi:MAG TPA: amidohydrolase family protein [Roseiflexaceae bacterium]|nr:amidohydrolase family protein [Roseiflexaceae bacterium]HMP42073.1 amidohydrolase family protein [Roseiflexaceae bacterium]